MDIVKQIEQTLEETIKNKDMKWNVNEVVNIVKGEWKSVPMIQLSEKQLQYLFKMYEESYSYIGLHPQIQQPDDIITSKKYINTLIVDLNRDNVPDAFIMYKKTPIGRKITLSGADGKVEGAKRTLIKKYISLLNTSGTFAEIGTHGKVYPILDSQGVNKVSDPEQVKQILAALKIKENAYKLLDDGTYIRTIGGSIKSREQIFGRPKLQLDEADSPNRQDTHEPAWEATKKRNREWLNILKDEGGTDAGPAYPEKIKTDGHISSPPMEEAFEGEKTYQCKECGVEYVDDSYFDAWSEYDEDQICQQCQDNAVESELDDYEEIEEMSGAGGASAAIQGTPGMKQKRDTIIREIALQELKRIKK